MKSKIIFPIILSAMLLTACNSGNQSADNIPSETELAETTSQTVTTISETETEVPETTTVTASKTAEETATTVTEIQSPKIENISENVTLNIETIDISSILSDDENYGRIFFLGDIAVIGTPGGKGEICFFDTTDQALKSKITPPEGWDFAWYYHCIKGSGDILCRTELYRYNEQGGRENAVLVVYNDFSTEIIEGERIAIPAGGHNISDVPYNIYDTDSGEIIVEGFEDTETELGLASKWFDYKFQIDDDRFVYRTCGFEWMPSFGYYDFAAGNAADFPNSEDFMPIGYHDGKIYAELTAWDGMCQGEMRTFDTETLESKIFMPPNQTSGKFTEYTMSPDGSFIIANDFDGSGINILRIISPDSGENLVKCELNFGGSYGSQFTFINDNSFAAGNGSELIIFDVKM